MNWMNFSFFSFGMAVIVWGAALYQWIRFSIAFYRLKKHLKVNKNERWEWLMSVKFSDYSISYFNVIHWLKYIFSVSLDKDDDCVFKLKNEVKNRMMGFIYLVFCFGCLVYSIDHIIKKQ